jgi:hypothetical protein
MRKLGIALSLGLLLLLPLSADAKEKPLIIPREHNGETVEFQISHDVFTIRCDGDSFGVKVKAPPGLQVRIGSSVQGVTNKHGVFITEIVPEINGLIFHSIGMFVRFPDGASVGLTPFVYSCPFDGPYDLKLHVVKAKNGKPWRDDVFIGFNGMTFTSTFARREFDLDRHGNLDTTALYQDGVAPGPGWYVCANADLDGPHRVRSVNGVPNPVPENPCQDLPPLDGTRIEVEVER